MSDYEESTWGSFLFFGKNIDTYYALQSGGYSVLRLINSSDINKILKDEEVKGTSASKYYLTTTVCELSDYNLGNIAAKAMKCTVDIVNSDNTNQRIHEYTTNCYLPLGNGQMLAYEQKVKPEGDVNMCGVLEKMGIHNVVIK